MSIGGYKIRNKAEIHFITFAVVEWVDVFTRKQYRDIVIDSLRHCQKEKGLILYAWCIMSNHVHLMAAAKENNLSDILRDFKKFTSKQLLQPFKTTNRKAGKNGCFPSSNNKAKRTAVTVSTSFGDKIINQKNVTVLSSVFKS